MANIDLAAIQIKTRRLAGVLAQEQYSNDDLNNDINLSILYDFPSSVQLFDLRRTFTFYTQPNIDKYSTNGVTVATTNTSSPMYNFKNAIVQSSDPVYIAGYETTFSQSRQEFINVWPEIQSRQIISVGDGATTVFTGTLTNIPILHENVQFTSIDANGLATALTAVPIVSTTVGMEGNETQDGNFYNINGPIATTPTVLDANNTINYVTGVYRITFPSAPASGENVFSNSVFYSAARPQSMLYFNDTFTLRPVPDGTYPVTIESQVRPTELINANDIPELEQWFEYICYMAAVKVCQNLSKYERIEQLQEELMKQEIYVLRRTLRQQGNKRAPSIYSGQTSMSRSPYRWRGYW